jgi:hypothetical protein
MLAGASLDEAIESIGQRRHPRMPVKALTEFPQVRDRSFQTR